MRETISRIIQALIELDRAPLTPTQRADAALLLEQAETLVRLGREGEAICLVLEAEESPPITLQGDDGQSRPAPSPSAPTHGAGAKSRGEQ